MRHQRITLDEPNEKLAWQLAGAMLASLLVIWAAGLWLHGGEPPAPAPSGSPELLRADATRPVSMRLIRFEASGSKTIARDAESGSVIRVLEFQADGFVSALVKSLDRDRQRQQLELGRPYRVVRWDNGQTVLEDPETGAQIELSAFGATNAAAFGALLENKQN